MLNYLPPEDDDRDIADEYMVEKLVMAMNTALEQASVPGITTPAEILSAIFTGLTRFLRATQHLQSPEDQKDTIHEVRVVLQDLLLQFGTPLN